MSETPLIEHVPTHLIGGPLGSGKTTLLKHLMKQRPDNEQWAILINEFGEVGIDAALLKTSDSGIQLAEIPGGCLCCVNGVPFQVGLGRLLRRVRPHRLFIEASGLGHPQDLLQQLAAPPWEGVLALQPLVMVLDAPKLVAGQSLVTAQQQALPLAGLVVLNKAEHLLLHERASLADELLPIPSIFCSQAQLPFAQVPLAAALPLNTKAPPIPHYKALPAVMWRNTQDWHCHAQQQGDYNSIGWKIHPHIIFRFEAVRDWLCSFQWQRAKGALHTEQGWFTFNGLDGNTGEWQASEWRQDNRLELIATAPLERDTLEHALRAALLQPPASDSRT
jgi:G3E family GTPase